MKHALRPLLVAGPVATVAPLATAQSTYPVPMATAGHLHSGGIDENGKGLLIKMEVDSILDLYHAKNLSGLCLQ